MGSFRAVGILDNIRNFEVGKLHSGNGVAVAGLSVPLDIFLSAGTQGIVDSLVKNAGGDIGGIPDSILFAAGDIVLINGQRASAAGIDDLLPQFGSRSLHRHGQQSQQAQTQGNGFFQSSHTVRILSFKSQVG